MAYLQSCTQDELVQLLRSDGRRQVRARRALHGTASAAPPCPARASASVLCWLRF